MHNKIIIRGAREHNLKNIDVEIPRNTLTVITGVSGSGKSSLAFDTIYADGQRRYMESLSSYARQFLGQMEKPAVDSIEGLSPAISIDQKSGSHNPRSTVGTVTEIYDYLRLLYARTGIPHCPVCNREIKKQTIDEVAEKIISSPARTRLQLLSPIVKGKKGEFKKEFDKLLKSGFVRVRIDGILYDLSEKITLDKNKKHDISVVVDRLIVGDLQKEDDKNEFLSRLTDSLETTANLSGGLIEVEKVNEKAEATEIRLFTLNFHCPKHGAVLSEKELTPRIFSFNNPFGACQNCSGLGVVMKISPLLLIPNSKLSLAQGALKGGGWTYGEGTFAAMYFDGVAKHFGFSVNTPVEDLPDEGLDAILYGIKEPITFNDRNRERVFKSAFEGVIPNLERRFKDTTSTWSKEEIQSYMSEEPCSECMGERLKKEILAVTIGSSENTKSINISDYSKKSISDAYDFISNVDFDGASKLIAEPIIKEIQARLNFLISVGLSYLTLSRGAGTLSGGESQRIRLATQIGSKLSGVLYVLDEPSIGLHQRDNDKLIETMKNLRDLGNTVIVVEHDEDTMKSADYIVDVGPEAGIKGGEILFAGTYEEILTDEKSVTGRWLSGKECIPVSKTRRQNNGKFLTIKGAKENNLKNIDVEIPLGIFVCVTGVSGSGKSSLVNGILRKHLHATLNRARVKAGSFDEITGTEFLDKIIDVNQSPIGRTPRSNPATYTGVWNDLRELFASAPEAKARGYRAGRFSFNVKGGRCEACQGDGIVKIEMHFLPDVYVPCDVCKGKRYSRETLEVKYKGKNVYEVLETTATDALEFFENIPKIKNKLKALCDVGLGYIKLGQSATTLSGGEAQRVKLASELSKRQTGKTIYILDEPTTGLHSSDVRKLLEVLERLVEAGNSVLVIEHNLDVIKRADYIIDLGPNGGDGGGEIVALGTPEEIVNNENSFTGKYLKEKL